MSDPNSPPPSPPPSPSPAAPDAAAPASSTLQRPDGLDERFWDPAAGAKWTDLTAELVKAKTFDERAALVPAKPEDYALALPEGFKTPDGVTIAFDAADPVLGPILNEARALAHEAGLPPAQFQNFLAVYAKAELATEAAAQAASKKSMSNLGVNAAGRVDAVHRFLDAHAGQGPAQHLKSMLVTSEQVEAFEVLMQAVSAQGSIAPGGRPDPVQTETRPDRAKRLFPSMN